MVGTKATVFPSARRRRDHARIAALSRITSGSCTAAAAAAMSQNGIRRTDSEQIGNREDRIEWGKDEIRYSGRRRNNKWEWDADASALQQLRKTAVTHEKMDGRNQGQPASGRESNEFSYDYFKNNTYLSVASRVDSFLLEKLELTLSWAL